MARRVPGRGSRGVSLLEPRKGQVGGCIARTTWQEPEPSRLNEANSPSAVFPPSLLAPCLCPSSSVPLSSSRTRYVGLGAARSPTEIDFGKTKSEKGGREGWVDEEGGRRDTDYGRCRMAGLPLIFCIGGVVPLFREVTGFARIGEGLQRTGACSRDWGFSRQQGVSIGTT